jgi:hydroxyethylthiazole kinase-like uncharacterized protein yjeF
MIIIDESFVRSIFKPRGTDSGKWDHGHALIVSGSRGKAGAAVLAAKACLRTGVGLLTVHVPSSIEMALQVTLPEAMLSLDSNKGVWTEIPDINFKSAVGIGPGIGTDKQTVHALVEFLNELVVPLIIDADGLNILSMYPELQDQLPQNTVLTPHHREFTRLVGKTWNNESELDSIARQYSSDKRIILVLKSNQTKIYTPDGHVFLNSTGNAGLAKGGSGDILTGIITSLLAQGYNSVHAAIMGCYLHGRAADLAVTEIAEESLLASDVVEYLSQAIKEMRTN